MIEAKAKKFSKKNSFSKNKLHVAHQQTPSQARRNQISRLQAKSMALYPIRQPTGLSALDNTCSHPQDPLKQR